MVYGTQHRQRRRYRGRKSRAGAKHKQRNFAAIMRICAARRRQLNGALGVVGTVEYAVVSYGGYGMVRRREAGGGGVSGITQPGVWPRLNGPPLFLRAAGPGIVWYRVTRVALLLQ